MMNKAQEITKYMRSEQILSRFADVLGEQGARRYVSSVLVAVANSKDLQACEPLSIYTSALRAATLQLSVDPSTGQAYLVPFRDKATLIVGWKGLYDLAVRTGDYRYINVGPVYEGQDVEFDQLTGFAKITGNKESDNISGYIGAFELMSGYAKVIYMTIPEIHEHKEKYSKGWKRKDSAWETSPEDMEKKTVLRRLLRKWGKLDPAALAILEEIENETTEIDGETIPEATEAEEDREPVDVEKTVKELGFE